MPQLSADHHSGFCTECNTEMKLLEGNDIRLHVPTAEEVNAREHCGMGHDAINSWILTEVRAKRLGVFGKCPKCKGKGETKLPRKMKKRYKNWHAYEPRTGPGYQLWETCTEGSPVSPVFESAEELADWCADNATIFAREKTSRENWLKMFVGEEDLEVGSMLVSSRDYSGVAINEPEETAEKPVEMISYRGGNVYGDFVQ